MELNRERASSAICGPWRRWKDGDEAEDIQFVNSPQFGTVVKVTAIEVARDGARQPRKPGRGPDDRRFHDLTRTRSIRLSRTSHLHRDLPVRMGIVIDTSGSMTETLPTVQRVVMGFLRDLLRPRDRAFIETFSDRPDMLTGFTADFTVIENALLGPLRRSCDGSVRRVIMGLFQFSGVTGRRAMVVLTDGDDTASENEFDDALGYAQRMGVTIYTIGIDIATTKVSTRWQLSKLASATGGRRFLSRKSRNSTTIYAEINRELQNPVPARVHVELGGSPRTSCARSRSRSIAEGQGADDHRLLSSGRLSRAGARARRGASKCGGRLWC